MSEHFEPKPDSEKYKSISEAKDWDSLFIALDQLGGLQGSKEAGNKFYSADELKIKIEDVRQFKRIPDIITRTGGLRDKVLELRKDMVR